MSTNQSQTPEPPSPQPLPKTLKRKRLVPNSTEYKFMFEMTPEEATSPEEKKKIAKAQYSKEYREKRKNELKELDDEIEELRGEISVIDGQIEEWRRRKEVLEDQVEINRLLGQMGSGGGGVEYSFYF